MEKMTFWAAQRYLERKGCEITGTHPGFIGALDDGVFVVAGVTFFTEGDFEDDPAPCRSDYERAMVDMAAAGEVPRNLPLRLDHVSIRVINEETAIIRHHIGLDPDRREDADRGAEACDASL